MARPKPSLVKGHFVKEPTAPFKSEAYKSLSNNAKLIFDLMAKGYTGFNNGSIIATYDGFKSIYGLKVGKAGFYKCISELIQKDLVFRIVKGHKGRVSRYALCLWAIDETDDVTNSKDYCPTKEPIKRYERHD